MVGVVMGVSDGGVLMSNLKVLISDRVVVGEQIEDRDELVIVSQQKSISCEGSRSMNLLGRDRPTARVSLLHGDDFGLQNDVWETCLS